MKRLLKSLLSILTLITSCGIFFSASAWALDIKVVDQQGRPVEGAFIAIPQGSITKVNPEPAIMDQKDIAFVPHLLAIEQGREVIFPNSDNVRHHVYSFSDPKRFEIKLYKDVPKNPILFDQPGLVALGCNIHDSMLGYILVSPWPEFKLSDNTGLVSLSKSVTEISVWHPWLQGIKEPMKVQLRAQEEVSMFQVTLNLTEPQPIKRLKKKYKKRYND